MTGVFPLAAGLLIPAGCRSHSIDYGAAAAAAEATELIMFLRDEMADPQEISWLQPTCRHRLEPGFRIKGKKGVGCEHSYSASPATHTETELQ